MPVAGHSRRFGRTSAISGLPAESPHEDNRLKHFRGIATRYFKTAANSLAAIHLAAARLWIRNYESTT